MEKTKVSPPTIIRAIIFGSKWLLVPFYFGLIIAQCFYCFQFTCEIVHLCKTFMLLTETAMMLAILNLLDITMVANLIKMIIAGSYNNFVEHDLNDHSSEKISSGMLKVKMGSSLIGVSSIHLLKVFIDPSGEKSEHEIFIKCGIHVLFLISTLALAYINYLHEKTEQH